jgi:hypothetical protein
MRAIPNFKHGDAGIRKWMLDAEAEIKELSLLLKQGTELMTESCNEVKELKEDVKHEKQQHLDTLESQGLI